MVRRILLRLPIALLLLGLALASCGAGNDLHQGHFSYGFETVAFRPCGSAEQWWVTGEGETMSILTERYAAIADASYSEVYVALRGRPSAAGTYGHLGAYQREFTVMEVVEVRATQPGDCT